MFFFSKNNRIRLDQHFILAMVYSRTRDILVRDYVISKVTGLPLGYWFCYIGFIRNISGIKGLSLFKMQSFDNMNTYITFKLNQLNLTGYKHL